MKINIWLAIVGGIISLSIGYYLNRLAQRKNNEILISEIRNELNNLEIQQATSRSSEEYDKIEKRINQLKGAENILLLQGF